MEEGMDVLTPVAVGVLLALFTGIQTWINKGRFDAQDRRFDALGRRMDAHEQSNERRFEQLFAEMAQLRSDLLQIALAATPQSRPQTG
jgi:hypothetical protein